MAVIALRGWHPAVARAEAIAMFPEACLVRTQARRLLTTEDDSVWTRAQYLSGTECVLLGGGIMEWTSIEDLLSVIDVEMHESMAVECWRHEGKLPIGTKEIEKQVGGLFHDVSSTFDLDSPVNRFGVVLDASAGLVAWGWIEGQGPGKQGWSAMRPNNRPFFKPVSLEPRLARAAVNIAAGPSTGYVVDPMCGTGGILIESALCNRPTLGIDSDPEMVEGTKSNLEWAEVKAEVVRGDATRHTYPDDLCAVVVDPPYGRNSQGETELLANTLRNIRSQHSDCGLVVILPTLPSDVNLDEEIESETSLFEECGFTVQKVLGIPIHKSLARKMIIASTSLQVREV